MTEHEICVMYREAKNKKIQLEILAELNGTRKSMIIGILVKNGEKLPDREINKLYKRLDILEAQIAEREQEYKEIVKALNSGKNLNLEDL